MRWPPLFPSADKTRTKTAPAANKQKVTASADRKSEPLKSARIERADGTERSYLFFRGAEADGCRIREAAVKHRTDYFKKESFADAADANAERLPLPLAGGLAQAPEADYETMSAEQFRTLRKQLKRAAMDGRRIRL